MLGGKSEFVSAAGHTCFLFATRPGIWAVVVADGGWHATLSVDMGDMRVGFGVGVIGRVGQWFLGLSFSVTLAFRGGFRTEY